MHASEMQAALTEIEIVSKDGRTEERRNLARMFTGHWHTGQKGSGVASPEDEYG